MTIAQVQDVLTVSTYAVYSVLFWIVVSGFYNVIRDRMASREKFATVASVENVTSGEEIPEWIEIWEEYEAIRDGIEAVNETIAQVSEVFERPVYAAKSAAKEATLVIPVDSSIEPDPMSLEALKEVAKALKIKGWNLYKDPVKLQAMIDTVTM